MNRVTGHCYTDVICTFFQLKITPTIINFKQTRTFPNSQVSSNSVDCTLKLLQKINKTKVTGNVRMYPNVFNNDNVEIKLSVLRDPSRRVVRELFSVIQRKSKIGEL